MTLKEDVVKFLVDTTTDEEVEKIKKRVYDKIEERSKKEDLSDKDWGEKVTFIDNLIYEATDELGLDIGAGRFEEIEERAWDKLEEVS